MAMKQKVVVSQSDITAGMMKDFWRMVGDGTINAKNFGGFLENPRRFEKSAAAPVRAMKILGSHRVFTPERVAEALNPLRKRAGLPELVPPQGVAVPYSDEVLKAHAGGKWLLVYSYGLSLREQRQMVGVDPNQQPCFHKDSTWWLNAKEDGWATKGVNPGWYLVSTEGRFGGQTWNQQEQSIREFGESYERADEYLMGEACLSAYLINNGERLLENFYHWGKSLGSFGYRVGVGYFGRCGLYVGLWVDYSDDSLRVCLFRKFQS